MKKFGLTDKQIDSIRDVLSHFPEVKEAVLYGSRAKGNYKAASDIDLTLKGSFLNTEIMNKIKLASDELPMPYKIDYSVFNHISNEELIDHIIRVGKLFYDTSDK